MQHVDEPMAVERGRREATPNPNPVSSRFIHIFNLVRPYTLNQLKEILQRTGSLVETGFWIDKIKSHCIAEYETSEQATVSRDALHGKKWPACNPKILRVEFSNENELDLMRNKMEGNPLPLRLDRSGNIGISVALVSANVAATAADTVKLTETTTKQDDARKSVREVRKSLDRPKEREVIRRREENERRREQSKRVDARPSQPPVRDWDRNKVRASVEREEERSRRRRRSSERGRRDSRDDEVKKKRRRRSDVENETPVVVNIQKADPSAKLLEDLFRKTKAATPCIYWLPLTEEQIADKETQNIKLEAERLQRRADRDKKLEEERDERIREGKGSEGGR